MRSRHSGRGTRLGERGAQSGVTYKTSPSGVTIDYQGVNDGGNWAVGASAKRYKLVGGIIDSASAVSWGTGAASNAMQVLTGLSGISSFTLTFESLNALSIATSAVTGILSYIKSGGGAVTVITYVIDGAGNPTPGVCLLKGVSASWLAYGPA